MLAKPPSVLSVPTDEWLLEQHAERQAAALVSARAGHFHAALLSLADVQTIVDALAMTWPPCGRPVRVRRLLTEFGHVEELAYLAEAYRG